MRKDKLRELATVLFMKIKKRATIDWTRRDSVKAKMQVLVIRTLRKYGYPPVMEKLAIETVLSRAEKIAGELVTV